MTYLSQLKKNSDLLFILFTGRHEIFLCLKNPATVDVWNPTSVSLNFRHPYVSENQTLGSDLIYFAKMPEIWTVWKPNGYWVSEIQTSSDFRHSLQYTSVWRGWIDFKKTQTLCQAFVYIKQFLGYFSDSIMYGA